jgi:hypothetical protein
LSLQALLDELPAEKQRQLTQSHRRTTATMAAIRQTLHDEHSCLVQVPAQLTVWLSLASASSCLRVRNRAHAAAH